VFEEEATASHLLMLRQMVLDSNFKGGFVPPFFF